VADIGGYQCPHCDRPAYPDYWRMLGCAGRDLAAAEDPDSPTGRILAARPVPRDDDTAPRRPTTADLTVYAVAALTKIADAIGELEGVAASAQAVVGESAADHAAMRDRLASLEVAVAALTPAPEPTPDPGPAPEPGGQPADTPPDHD
jgi:hypothetical protein